MNQLPPYPHVMDWDRMNRKGQRCEILRAVGARVHIKFMDGSTGVVERAALRRAKPSEMKTGEQQHGSA